jgi:glycine cleavage system H protein|tara:strand:+ start:297 stop:686 length:390 start_codon:yes stop_codon:yes gene_type:complete
MESPKDRKYSKEHEWVKLEGDVATCGITDFAQHQLTDIVFIELPEKGKQVEQAKQIAVVESVKSVSDIFAPVSGEIIEINEKLTDNPETVNKNPFDEGWMFKIKIKDKAELDKLLSAEDYEKFTKEEKH